MPRESFGFGLLRRREVVVPSLRGSILLAGIFLAVGWVFLKGVQPFLAVNRPIGGDILVVEGWIPDYAMREALQGFRTGQYRMLVTTGGPLPQGMAYSSYGTYAQLAAHTLLDFGLGKDSLVAVPSPDVGRDRTHQEGVSFKEWLRATGTPCRSIDLVSFSSHARRSRLLYRMALGRQVEVGVYAPRDLGYDPAAWWRTSNGFRRVTDEVIAYLYAKLIFRG